jgi:hypothetical protein
MGKTRRFRPFAEVVCEAQVRSEAAVRRSRGNGTRDSRTFGTFPQATGNMWLSLK